METKKTRYRFLRTTIMVLDIIRDVVNELLMGAFMTVFFLTAYLKWSDMPKFVGQMERMPFADWMAGPIAYGLPTTMGLLGTWLLFAPYRRIPVAVGTSLFAGMAIFVRMILDFRFGPTRPCSCAGLFDLSWQIHFEANCWLTAIGLFTLVAIRRDNEPLIPIVRWTKWLWRKIKQANLSGLSLNWKGKLNS